MDALQENAKRVRHHAGFFDWPNKEIKELGVIKDLVESVGGELARLAIRPGRPDPPDAVGEREDGGLVAIEVTELVDQQVLAQNIRSERESAGMAPPEHRAWDKPGLIAAIGGRLTAKDGVNLQGGPFQDYLVVLHTDEAMLSHSDASEWVGNQTFIGMKQIKDAYLLFSYDGEGYKYIRLQVSSHD